jgi:hypothetical protein
MLFAAGVGMVVVAAVPSARKAITSLFDGGHDEWANESWQSTPRDVDGVVESDAVVTTAQVEPQ